MATPSTDPCAHVRQEVQAWCAVWLTRGGRLQQERWRFTGMSPLLTPDLLLAGEYPYFRDDPAAWASRLDLFQQAQIPIVSTYVPWRHHEPQPGTFDFTGITRSNRDLVGFLRLAKTRGLRVILKPGPFVHGELPYGGLPDHAAPEVTGGEAELDSFGRALEWPTWDVLPSAKHTLPAPLDERYLALVERWMLRFANDIIVPFDEEGFVVGIQLLNEGIYSDTSQAGPKQLGFAPSSLDAMRMYIAREYGSLAAYNATHTRAAAAWSQIQPPRRVQRIETPEGLLDYLDWSAFQSQWYVQVAQTYHAFLLDAGLRPSMPIYFNFNPNSSGYRSNPASNDGWYTRAFPATTHGFQHGLTDWVGVVANDPEAYRQFVMALTARRGPALELDWGFSREYAPPYSHATPCLFETILALACGATGINAYTVVGTRAWRDDPHLAAPWYPARTNRKHTPANEDYPGSAPVDSEGRTSPKLEALTLLYGFLRHEASCFARARSTHELAWGVYPPWAFAGQWLPGGDADDLYWRPPLATVPRAAYHGLDAFVELCTNSGTGFQQVDLSQDADLPESVRVLCIAGHSFMSQDAQRRIGRFVRRGGTLLLTGSIPDRDEKLRPAHGELATLFPHGETRWYDLDSPARVMIDGNAQLVDKQIGILTAPSDALFTLTSEQGCAGYARRAGQGSACYLAAEPWRAQLSGDDHRVATEGQELVSRLIGKLSGERTDPRALHPAEAVVWQRAADTARILFVLARGDATTIEIQARDIGPIIIHGSSQASHMLVFEGRRLRSCFLTGVNDTRSERVRPAVTTSYGTVEAAGPGDAAWYNGEVHTARHS